MSTDVNLNLLKAFVMNKIGNDVMDREEAQDLHVDEDIFADADIDASGDLDIDEILNNSKLYEQFATMYAEENEQADAEDEETKKKAIDERRLSGKNGSKA